MYPANIVASPLSVVQQARLMDSAGTAWHAVKYGNLEMITKLFPNKCNVYERGPMGENILHIAMLLNTPTTLAIARYLVRLYGKTLVNCPAQDRRHVQDPPGPYEGETALHIAVVNRDLDMVRFLVQNGADIGARAYGSFFEHGTKMYYGEYPLSFAASTGQKDIVAYLTRHGAHVSEDSDVHGNTALHMCVFHDQREMYDYLVEYCGARENVRNAHGLTPLTLAAHLGRTDMLQHIYNRRRRAFYTFGNTTSYSLGLREIDTVQDEKQYVPTVLETLIRKGHYHLLNEPLVRTILRHKWKRFGAWQFVAHFTLYLIYVISQTVLVWLISDTTRWNSTGRASQEYLGFSLSGIMLSVELYDYWQWLSECYHRRLRMRPVLRYEPPLYPTPGDDPDSKMGRPGFLARLSMKMGMARVSGGDGSRTAGAPPRQSPLGPNKSVSLVPAQTPEQAAAAAQQPVLAGPESPIVSPQPSMSLQNKLAHGPAASQGLNGLTSESPWVTVGLPAMLATIPSTPTAAAAEGATGYHGTPLLHTAAISSGGSSGGGVRPQGLPPLPPASAEGSFVSAFERQQLAPPSPPPSHVPRSHTVPQRSSEGDPRQHQAAAAAAVVAAGGGSHAVDSELAPSRRVLRGAGGSLASTSAPIGVVAAAAAVNSTPDFVSVGTKTMRRREPLHPNEILIQDISSAQNNIESGRPAALSATSPMLIRKVPSHSSLSSPQAFEPAAPPGPVRHPSPLSDARRSGAGAVSPLLESQSVPQLPMTASGASSAIGGTASNEILANSASAASPPLQTLSSVPLHALEKQRTRPRHGGGDLPVASTAVLKRSMTSQRKGGGDMPASDTVKLKRGDSRRQLPYNSPGSGGGTSPPSAGGAPGGAAGDVEAGNPPPARLEPHVTRLRAFLDSTRDGLVGMTQDPWLFIWHTHLVLTWIHFFTWVSTYGGVGGAGPTVPVQQFDDIVVSGMALTGWIAVLYFYRGLKATGVLAVIFERCILDVIRFILMYFLWCIGFSLAFYTLIKGTSWVVALSQGVAGDSPYGVRPDQGPFMSISEGMITLIQFPYGGANYDTVCDLAYHSTEAVCAVYYLLYMATVVVLLLNLLIAMIIRTYNTTQEQGVLQWRRRWAIYVLKAERRMPRSWQQRARLGQLAYDPGLQRNVYSHVFEVTDTQNEAEREQDHQVKLMEQLLESYKKQSDKKRS